MHIHSINIKIENSDGLQPLIELLREVHDIKLGPSMDLRLGVDPLMFPYEDMLTITIWRGQRWLSEDQKNTLAQALDNLMKLAKVIVSADASIWELT